ncbi:MULTISPECIES: hypothetical protein [Streptomyces]|uniref:hypothetical protein n=1 Tax=Streptomyces TaxID=1883 RepID=UPI0002EF5B43|nr:MULTISPECIES: hypothetical protein [Streptomyces]MCC3655767.1 hypothetical protein [Streptomyces sp. S07_1.15]MZE76817.1 hypothetical protein [Streptomyces sp. SID5475]
MIIPDPKTPVGRAVIALRQELTELEERKDGWPGADVVDILGTWLALFDFGGSLPREFTDEEVQ